MMILFAAGCALQMPIPDSARAPVWEQTRAKLAGIHHWKLNARVAIQMGKEGGTVTMIWQQSGDEYLIRIIPPLGRGAFELAGNSDGVAMRGANEQIFHASDAETLLQTQLGWHVPLTGLIYWVRGIPDPSTQIEALVLDEQARLQSLLQDQWQLTYMSYIQTGEFNLPKKLTMQNQNLKVKLLVKQWDLSE